MEFSRSDIAHLSHVPLTARRSPMTMGLVWITMVTSFPTAIIGFAWFKQGFSLSQVLICTLLSCLLLLIYSIPATQLGARTGLGYCALSRTIFGRWGTWLVTANLIWVFVAWYGITAVWMAQAVRDLLHVQLSVLWMSVIFAFLMAFNNFFGFTGVANFARFFAAPTLIAWVGYTFFRAASHAPTTVLIEPSHQSTLHAMTVISSFVIGFAVWGNESDYWRFSKVGALRSMIPLAVAVLIGEIMFPVAGWLVARMTGITGSAAATAFMNDYSFAGIAIIGIVILAASYFASNDSNLFGLSTAIESFWALRHKVTVTILALIGALTAAFLSIYDSTKALDVIASLNCIFMPMPTVLLLSEWYLRERVFFSPFDFRTTPHFAQLPAIRWPATLAWITGVTVGVATSGLIPGFENLHVGICPLQSWLTAALVYAFLRQYEYKRDLDDRKLIVEANLAETRRPEVVGADK